MKKISKYTFIYGILGICLAAGLHFALYVFQRQQLFTTLYFIVSILPYALVMYAGTKAFAEKQIGSADMEFKAFLRVAFSIFLLINIGYYAYEYFIYVIFDPALENDRRLVYINYLKGLGNLKPEQYQDVYNKVMQEPSTFTFSAIAQRFATGAIGGFLVSAFIAYLVRRAY